MLVSTTQTRTKRAIAPRSGRNAAQREPVGAPGAEPGDPRRSRRARTLSRPCTRPSPSSANVVPTTTERKAHAPAPSPDTVPSRSIAREQQPLHERHDDRDGNQEHAQPEEEAGRLTYILAEAEMIWPHDRRRAIRSGATGVQVARTAAKITRPSNGRDGEEERKRVAEELRERPRARRDRGAEEVGRARAEGSAGRHGVAPIAPVLGPGDRLRPLRLQVRAGRAVEERLLELAPATFERDPGIRGLGGGPVARDRHDARGELAVWARVSSQPTPASAELPEPERIAVLVGVGAGGRINDRTIVHELELLVAPRRHAPRLRASCTRPRRSGIERRRGVGRVEDELDHLPVALVRVVEVVERVEEPVLERRACPPRRRRARRRPARCPPSGAAPRGCSRSPGRAHRPGSRGGTRSGRRGRPRTGPISTRSVRFHGPRSATVCSSRSRSMSVGTNGSP